MRRVYRRRTRVVQTLGFAPPFQANTWRLEQGDGWVGVRAAGLTGRQFQAPKTSYRQWFEDLMGADVPCSPGRRCASNGFATFS